MTNKNNKKKKACLLAFAHMSDYILVCSFSDYISSFFRVHYSSFQPMPLRLPFKLIQIVAFDFSCSCHLFLFSFSPPLPFRWHTFDSPPFLFSFLHLSRSLSFPPSFSISLKFRSSSSQFSSDSYSSSDYFILLSFVCNMYDSMA